MKIIRLFFKNIKILLLGWGIIFPLSFIVPQKKNLLLFIGKNEGGFFDNVKFLYLYLCRLGQNSVEYYFLTEKKHIYEILKRHNLPAVLHPTPKSIYLLLRARVLVSSSTKWKKKYKYHLSHRAKKVQLWHGIPLKKIGMLIPKVAKCHNSPAGRLYNAIRGKNHIHDLFVSTSEFFTSNVFAKAMRAKKIIETGYPRNDVFFKEQLDEYDLIEADVKSISRINKLRRDGFKAVLYAPTYGDPVGNAIKSGPLNLNELSQFAKKHKLIFVLKFHPSIHCVDEFKSFDNIIIYDRTKDIQPLLKVSDILITDYSSVYMDYLLLDRPIIFFPYNYKEYMEVQGGLLFDYDSMTPGPKCYSLDQLQESLINCVVNQTDEFSEKRKEIRKLAFKYQDGKASERIWDFIRKEYLKILPE